MKRALLLFVICSACAAQRGAKAPTSAPHEPSSPAPQSAPMPSDHDGIPDSTGTTSMPPPTTATTPEGTSAGGTAPVPKTSMPAGGGGGASPGAIAKAQSAFDDAAKVFSSAGVTDCLQLCKALASMTNATEHLCTLVQGTTDQKRCTDARIKLESAQSKVKSSCGTC